MNELLFFGPRMHGAEWLNHSANQWDWPGDAVSACTKLMRFDLMKPVVHAEVEVVWIPIATPCLNLMVVDYINGGVPVNAVGILNPQIQNTSGVWNSPRTERQDVTAALNSFIAAAQGVTPVSKYLAWQIYGGLSLAKFALYLWD